MSAVNGVSHVSSVACCVCVCVCVCVFPQCVCVLRQDIIGVPLDVASLSNVFHSLLVMIDLSPVLVPVVVVIIISSRTRLPIASRCLASSVASAGILDVTTVV
jgi:hypothetical protein